MISVADTRMPCSGIDAALLTFVMQKDGIMLTLFLLAVLLLQMSFLFIFLSYLAL